MRPWSPRLGSSTLITSAPSQANVSVHDVPASNWVRATTRTPARAGRPLDSLGCTWPVYERRRELEEGLATPTNRKLVVVPGWPLEALAGARLNGRGPART